MDRVSSLNKQLIHGDERQNGVVERKHIEKRSTSMPMLRRQNWIPREKSYVPGEKPSRSVSLRHKMKKFRHCPRAAAARERYDAHFCVGLEDDSDVDDNDDNGDGYDSDEEDRRNGVPVTVTNNAGFALVEDIEHEVQDRMQQAHYLRGELKKDWTRQRRKYAPFREQYAAAWSRGGVVDWTAGRWLDFLEVEDKVYRLRDEMTFLERRVQDLFAQRISFGDHDLLRSAGGRWSRQGDIAVWSMLGAAEDWAGDEGYRLPLTYKGVDYNTY
ncbi:hypothetical protein F5X99DRAFT_407951 [Biscogniauxia marginata]|nr:hypothetical protein F5X99DRAFT_407951 [Biscogniauxia marginata]